ncbi:MAG: DUF992 domain-containing protein [Rhodospirillaceae bacterium]
MKKILIAAAAVLGIAFSAAGEAKADGALVLGSLTCTKSGQGITYVVFSSNPVECTYNGVGGPLTYTGTSGIALGVDLEIEQQAVFSFLVVGGGTADKNALTGTYVGVKASATVGGGITAQAGLGGAGNGFSLVPVGLGGQVGIGVTAGVSYLQIAAK